jgi:hypothetical protein
VGFGEVRSIEEGRQLFQRPSHRQAGPLNAADEGFEALDKGFDRLESKMEWNHGQIMVTLHRMESNLRRAAERLARLESK